MDQGKHSSSEFDAYASSYRQAMDAGLSLSGESSEYFARQRVSLLKQHLDELGAPIHSILDLGCGTGGTIPILQQAFETQDVTGIDVSPASLAIARDAFPEGHFFDFETLPMGATFDLVYTNGVFHHVAKTDRPSLFQFIANRLTAHGYLAFWENNPFSLPARWVRSRIAFDGDAEMVWPAHARALAKKANLSVMETRYEFIFPKALSALRFLEAALHSCPLGAQYLMLARKAT